MRPVAPEHEISQDFAGMPTAGVAPSWTPNTVGWYVRLYGDYQPFGHAGCDIGCPVGTPVYAIHGGAVIWCDWDVNLPGGPGDWYSRWFFYQAFGGRLLLIKTFYGHIHAYAHLSAFKVKYGDSVKEGQLIALSGDSAAGQDHGVAPHLHVEKIVDLNYTTGGGLIYGRTDPSVDFTSFKPLTTTAKKGLFVTLTPAQEQECLKAARLVNRYINAPTGDIPRKAAALVWATTVLRGGKKISALQELADAKSLAQKLQAENADLKLKVAALAPAVPATEVIK